VSATPSGCRGTLARILRRDLAGWEGLPDGCTERGIARWLPLRAGEGIAHLGSERVEYRFRAAETSGFSETVRLYFRDGTLRLVRTGLWSTEQVECDRVLRELGDPQDRLDLLFGVQSITDGEWIYPSRGLSVAVLPGTRLIADLAAYQPSTVDTFRRCLHECSPPREFA
jgi:hypothetical protein